MSTVSHQTAHLSRGNHRNPTNGVCVMELASMLAGQRFTDHPETVSPVIGSFLRGYNDGLGDDLRQSLKRYAADSLGTAAGPDLEDERRALVAQQMRGALRRRFMTAWIAASAASDDAAVAYAARAIGRQVHRTGDVALHARVLELVDALIAMGPQEAVADADGVATSPAAIC